MKRKEQYKALIDEEVLKECISIAVDNGWDINPLISDWINNRYEVQLDDEGWYIPYEGQWLDLSTLLFNHDFCKALFGEQEFIKGAYLDNQIFTKHWHYHISQLAISEDRIGYLKKWLNAQ